MAAELVHLWYTARCKSCNARLWLDFIGSMPADQTPEEVPPWTGDDYDCPECGAWHGYLPQNITIALGPPQ